MPVVVDNRLYDLRLTDCPTISHFPATSLQEWADYRGYGLRHAAAYILVYDSSDEDSFSYVRFMRDQILTHRGAQSQHDVPIVVAANKADLQASAVSYSAVQGGACILGPATLPSHTKRAAFQRYWCSNSAGGAQ